LTVTVVRRLGPSLSLNLKPLTITIKGTCTENVLITRDDVTITTDGVNPASIVAADATLPTVELDGAHRIIIEGVAGAGISISGGTNGVNAVRGSTLTLGDCVMSGNSANGVVSSYWEHRVDRLLHGWPERQWGSRD
jgi:hypothetical protein